MRPRSDAGESIFSAPFYPNGRCRRRLFSALPPPPPLRSLLSASSLSDSVHARRINKHSLGRWPAAAAAAAAAVTASAARPFGLLLAGPPGAEEEEEDGGNTDPSPASRHVTLSTTYLSDCTADNFVSRSTRRQNLNAAPSLEVEAAGTSTSTLTTHSSFWMILWFGE